MAARSHTGVALGQLLPPGLPARGLEHISITGLSLDSRRVREGYLFLAVRGWKRDGREFIPQAVAGGCAAVLAEAENFDAIYPADGTVVKNLEQAGVPLLLVPDLQSHVSAIAANFHGHPGRDMDVIGVTGTNGKTTCVSLIARLGHLLGNRSGLIGTLGWGVTGGDLAGLEDTGMTTPDAIALQEIQAELRRAGVDVLAMEVSSHGLEQRRVSDAGIDCAVFTNLSRDHLDFHGSEERYAAAKSRLFSLPGLKRAVVNIDDPQGRKIHDSLAGDIDAVTYGFSADADVRAENPAPDDKGTTFRIRSPWGEGEVRTGLLGTFNILNLLAVIAVYCQRGVALEAILSLVPELAPVPGRMEVVSREQRPRVIVDYSHTPDALKCALDALRTHCAGRLWCVFGCGGDRDNGKRPEMGAIAEQMADRVVVTSDNPRSEEPEAIIDQILVGMTQLVNVRVIADRREAIETAIAEADPADCILIAGKGHENYQQVGDEKRPFSDMDVARSALAAREGLS